MSFEHVNALWSQNVARGVPGLVSCMWSAGAGEWQYGVVD